MSEDYPKKDVLDHGFVRLIDHMGDDQRIVNAARVSYQKGTKKVSSDRGLIRYLLRHLHTTPFEKIRFEFHVKVPMFIARQWMRHRMGSFNEVSARYSILPDEFYIPDSYRGQSETNRQGSSDQIISDLVTTELAEGDTFETEIIPTSPFVEQQCREAYEAYSLLIENNVARELARSVLPVNIYTEFYWTVDLWNLMHFLRLRLDGHAQKEIQEYAQAIYNLIIENCDLPAAMEAFQDYIVDAPNISKFELEVVQTVLSELSAMNIGDVSLKDMIQQHVDDHPRMMKREKAEHKLHRLLLLEDED